MKVCDTCRKDEQVDAMRNENTKFSQISEG